MSFKNHVAAIVVTGCFVAASGSAQAEDSPRSAGDKWGAWTEFGGYGANRTDARRGEATVWAPLVQDSRSLVFADLRGRFFDEGTREGNFALGYRRVGDYGWNPGFWVSFDRRHSGYDTDFNQVSFGLEALSPNWDLRLNAYVPLNDTELAARAVSASPTVEVAGGTILLIPGPITVSDLYEISFWGVDAEVGFRIPLERWGPGAFNAASLGNEEAAASSHHHDLRIFVGGYYFDHQDFDGQIAGPRLRAEWRIENIIEDWDGSRLTFEAAYQYDDVRDSQLEAGLRLRIPLGGGASTLNDALSPQEQRMTEGLKRDRDIVAQTKMVSTTAIGAPEAVEDAVTGVDFDSVTIVANGDDFDAALQGAGSNALLVALGGGTNFGAVSMLVNQTLLGGGGSLRVRGRTTGILGTYVAPGVRPTFQTVGLPVIKTADNAHIKSLDIQNYTYGILVLTSQKVVVDDTGITGTAIGILSAGEGLNLTVRNSTFSGGGAISVAGENNVLLAENNVFRDMWGNAIWVFRHLPIDGMVNVGSPFAGNTGNNITVVGNRFEGTFGGYLFDFFNGITKVTAGSTGNVDATTSSDGKCIRDFGATLVGSINFEGGAFVAHGNCFAPYGG